MVEPTVPSIVIMEHFDKQIIISLKWWGERMLFVELFAEAEIRG